MKPRVLLVGRTRFRLPLRDDLLRKFEAMEARMNVRVLASAADGATGDGRFHLVPRARVADGLLFYLLLPFRVARELRDYRPDAVIAESPYEGTAVHIARAITGSDARVIVELHGDWRTATRLYGSPARRLLSPLGDRLAAMSLRRADAVRAISDYTAGLVRSRGLEPAGVFPTYSDLGEFAAEPAKPLPDAPRAIFVGVLESYKNVEGLADAWRHAAPSLPGATLHIVGRGTQHHVPEALVRDLPAQTEWTDWLDPPELARAIDDATVLVLPSNAEGLGRVILEAFLRGRGVIATRVGGIPDLVTDGVNGLLVERGDTQGLADAIVRVLSDPALARTLGERARASVESWLYTPESYAERLLSVVGTALDTTKPRLLLVGRTRYQLPLDESLERKFDALRARFELRVLASSAGGSGGAGEFRLVRRLPLVDGPLFYVLLPFRVAREVRAFRPDAVVTQSPYEGAAVLMARFLSRARPRVVVELHGDWRTATRLYGSSARRLVSPVADAVAAAVLRRADAVRTLPGATVGLAREQGIEPAAAFPAFMDFAAFLEREPQPLPETPQAIFVGALEPVKNVDVLANAWRRVVGRLPDARLRIVGSGSRASAVRELAAELPANVDWTEWLQPPELARAFDESSVLVLPSRSEGFGRVAVEAFCRGRGVVASRAVELVDDGRNGLVVDVDDPEALADALVRALLDRDLAARLGVEARRSADEWIISPQEYAGRLRGVVDHALGGS